MAFLNKVMLIGRLTDRPEEPRVLPNTGSTVVKFRFAVGRSKKDPQTGQWINDPNPLYIDCEAFSRSDNTRLTDLITRYCDRGTQLFLEGRLQFDTWEDKNNPGQKRSKHKIVVDSIQFIGSAAPGGSGGGGGYADQGTENYGTIPGYSGGGGYSPPSGGYSGGGGGARGGFTPPDDMPNLDDDNPPF